MQDDNSTNGITRYQNGPGIDNKLRIEKTGGVEYFLTDHLGSTNALADQAGTITSSTNCDSFGNPTGTVNTRYQYTGRELDADIGLYYYRARWYDSEIGRFISEDPIGFLGGDFNLFGYVRNNPANTIDPLGESIWTKLFRVVRVYDNNRRLVRQLNEINKNRAIRKIKEALDVAGDKPIVRTQTEEARDVVAKALSDNGKLRGPEKHPGFPTHVHPQTGPYRGTHIQTRNPQPNSLKKGAIGASILAAFIPFSAEAAENPCTTNLQFASAALWDVASTVDPIFLTDLINYATGLDGN